jgi:hypothetical protein
MQSFYFGVLRPLVVIALLSVSLLKAAPDVAETVRSLKPGRRIELVLQNHDKVIGNIGAVHENDFVLEPDHAGQVSREVRYADIRSVRTKKTRTEKWLIAGGIYAALTIIGLLVGG